VTKGMQTEHFAWEEEKGGGSSGRAGKGLEEASKMTAPVVHLPFTTRHAPWDIKLEGLIWRLNGWYVQ